jgi:hypothetical protein
MTCITITSGTICLAKTDFTCPYCWRVESDANEKYYKRIVANKCGYTKVKCKCGEHFGLTGDYRGDYLTFKL